MPQADAGRLDPPRASRSRPTRLVVLLAGLFFLSGASGLIYQVLWLRLLGLVFGVTVQAASTVWAAFMAGLAAGSIAGGRIGDRSARPLLWFGAAEALIGITALLTPGALDGLQHVFAVLAPRLPESLAVMTLVRLALAFAVLLVPTMLMGASLPLIVKSALVRREDLGSRISLLYGINTAGAIAGTLAAGLLLIPSLGLTRTFVVAAAANISVGLTAIVVSRRTAGAPAGSNAAAPADDLSTAPAAGGLQRLLLGVFFVSGLATLALEVVWFRVIALLVRPTVYAFALMLASVLLGIAAGSAVMTPLMRRRRPWLPILATIQVVMGLAALGSLAMLNYSPSFYTAIEPRLPDWLPAYLMYTALVAAPAVLPVSLLMGAAFPIGLLLYAGAAQTSSQVASGLGVFYAVNVTGAIAGSLLAGFVLLPQLGSRGSLIVVAAAMTAAGLALFLRAPRGARARLAAVAAVGLLFAVTATAVADPFDAYLRERAPDDDVIWREESIQATVSVHRQPDGTLSLHLEGNHQASDSAPMVRSHRQIGHLAMVVHPRPLDALVIGLGGGVTAGAVSLHGHARVDVVELSGAVVRGARHFAHVNHDVLRRPNVRLRVDDGRNYVAQAVSRYDVITADIILPTHAGANNLYAAEYFRLVRRALRPGGMFLQWVAGSDEEYKLIVRTFLSVFPDATAWSRGSLLLGTLEPLRLRRGDFEWKTIAPQARRALQDFGTATFEDVLALYTAGPDELRAFVGEGRILTDDRPLVEYFLSLRRDRPPDLRMLRGDVRRHVE